MNDPKIILATAYAMNPYKGSEDGMGWNFVLQIARFNKVIAITRLNNRTHIEKFMNENPNPHFANIQFVYFDLPYWMRFWKKGGRGAMLYYWMWQRAMPAFIRRQNFNFDIVHNVNFHNDWTPSYLWKLNKPFVWGPIGHHSAIPKDFITENGFVALVKDRLTWIIKKFFWNFSTSLNNTVAHADHILCMNSDVACRIPLRNKKFSVMPSVATEDYGIITKSNERFTIISAGRFVPLKGFDLTILSFMKFLNSIPIVEQHRCELIIVGSGPLKEELLKLVSINDLENNVRFIEWIERKELMKLYREASLFLFPSHEGAGMVVAEALSYGLPVVCLDNEGPGEFIDHTCGIAIPNVKRNETVEGLGKAIHRIYSDDQFAASLRAGARKRFIERFHWDRRGDALSEIYKSLVA
jgi:glycosyltransferase involved in cell wall biosynthesis